METIIAKIVVPKKVQIKLARVIEHSPFAKKFHGEGMASEVRQAVNRWLYDTAR